MKNKVLISALVLMGTLSMSGVPLWAAQGIIYKAVGQGNYCHLKFPAIREDTLYSNRPVLKDPSDGDVIDFYGDCDHDPLGKDEVMRQRDQERRERNRGGD